MQCYYITKDNVKINNISLIDVSKKITNYNKRDFYFFDSRINFDISSLTIKKNCIICKFDNIKGVIFKDEAYIIFELLNISNINNFSENNLPFHLNIIEYLLKVVTESFDTEFNKNFNTFLNTNKKLEISNNLIDKQSNLLNLEYRVKELQTITEDLIKNKEDLIRLTFDEIQYEDVEQMIENYNFKIDDIYYDISKLLKEIDNSQKIENIKLAQDRNKYALMNLYVSFISLSFSFGSFIGSMFGMNLKNYIEYSNISFIIIITFTLLIMIAIIKVQYCYLKKL